MPHQESVRTSGKRILEAGIGAAAVLFVANEIIRHIPPERKPPKLPLKGDIFASRLNEMESGDSQISFNSMPAYSF